MRIGYLAALAALLCACPADDGPDCDAGADDPVALDGHRLRVRMRLHADPEGVSFLTPAASVFALPEDDIVAKPYYVGVFAGGLDQGVDLSLHHAWGVVSDDLEIVYETPPMLADGPYDVALIVYTQNPVSDETMASEFAQVPLAGELSAFTLSQDEVREGDPGFPNGVVRVNIEGADAELVLENRVPDMDRGIGVLKAFTNTIVTVP